MTSSTFSEGSCRRSAGTSEAEFPLPDVEIPISRRLAPPSQIAPDCDIPVPTTEYIDPAYRLRLFLTQRPITTPTPSSSSSGTPEPSETSDRAREQSPSPSPSRGPSLSESRSSRSSPSVYPTRRPPHPMESQSSSASPPRVISGVPALDQFLSASHVSPPQLPQSAGRTRPHQPPQSAGRTSPHRCGLLPALELAARLVRAPSAPEPRLTTVRMTEHHSVAGSTTQVRWRIPHR